VAYPDCSGKISIPRHKVITLVGFNDPLLVYNANHNSTGGTGKSSSTRIFADNFIAHNITFQVVVVTNPKQPNLDILSIITYFW
jgi:hypothetical protein